MDCAMCGSKGLFQVEDLPVGPRWFCTEKHFAEYAGLPVKEFGYYGFEAEELVQCKGHLPSCKKMIDPNRIWWIDEKGEEWPALDEYGEEGYCDDCIGYSIDSHSWALAQGHDAEGELERKYFTRFGDQRGGQEWGEYTFTWFNDVGDWKPIEEDTKGWDDWDYADFREQKEYELVNDMLSDSDSELYGWIENHEYGHQNELYTSYEVLNEDGEKEVLGLLISWEEPEDVQQKIQYYNKEPLHQLEFLAEESNGKVICDGPQNIDAYVLFDSPDLMAAESKKLPPIEKAEITGIASGATMEGLDLALAGEMFECQDCDERCHICGTGQLHEHIIDCEVCKEPFCRKRCWGCWECEAICERCEGQCPTHINPNEIMEYDRENPIPDKPYSRTHKIGTMPWQKDTGCITYWEDGEVCRYCENDDWTKANKDYEQYWTWKNANRKREQFIRKAEGLETLLAAETLTGYRSKTDKRQMLDELAHSIYKKELTSEKVFPGIRVSSKVVLYPDGDTKKERDLSRFQMSMKYSDRMVHQCDNCGIWASSKQTNSWEKDKSREGKKNEIVYYQKDVVNPSEYFGYCVKCYDNLSEKGQLGSNPFSAEEEQSVYYWVKTEMENRHPLSQSDLEQLLDMISFNVPLSNIEFGIAQAEEMGDEPTYIILELAHKKAKFIKKYQAEEEEEEDDEDDGYWNEGEAPWRESASKYDEFDESNPFSLSNLLWLNNHGGVPKLNDGEHYVLKKLKSLLYNWDGEPEYSDVFQEDLQKACGDYPSSLKRTLNSLSKKGLIDVQNVPTGEYKQTTWKFTRDKDGNLIPITKPLIYPKPLMVLYAINMGWGNPEWLQYALDDSKKQTIFHTEEYKVADEDWAGQSCEDCYEEIKVGDSVHDDGYVLICKKCYSNYKIPCEHEACGERFKNKEEEEEHRQETCHNCDGEGWIVTHYTPATYHDPADIDGEDCEECGGEGWVCDEFNAESFSADEQKACHRCGNTEKDGKLWWVGSRKGFICSDCSDGGKKYRAESFSAESNGDITIRQQAIDTIEARVADYTTHEDVSPYWGGGIVNPNKYLYFKLRYAWNNHPEQREEIIQQYMRGIKEGEIDPSNPLPHGAPNQHLPSQWDAESFSAESNGDLQLDESKKRTKMSAIRTGLAITTFGIVMWNLWTNKKQEKDIADIMDLV